MNQKSLLYDSTGGDVTHVLLRGLSGSNSLKLGLSLFKGREKLRGTRSHHLEHGPAAAELHGLRVNLTGLEGREELTNLRNNTNRSEPADVTAAGLEG